MFRIFMKVKIDSIQLNVIFAKKFYAFKSRKYKMVHEKLRPRTCKDCNKSFSDGRDLIGNRQGPGNDFYLGGVRY